MTSTLAMMDDYLEEHRRINEIDAVYNFDQKTIVLEGIEVKGRKDERNDPFYRAGKLYNAPDDRLVVDSIPGASSALSIFDLLQRVAGGSDSRYISESDRYHPRDELHQRQQ